MTSDRQLRGAADVTVRLPRPLVELEDGTYLAVWTWEARELCDRAMASVDQVVPVKSWLAHTDQDISMEFGGLVESAAVEA